MTLIAEEAALAALAAELAGRPAGTEANPRQRALAEVRAAILAGGDPLGEAFCRLRPARIRRASGATFTPAPIITAMVEWAAGEGGPGRIVDPGAGSGRFVLAAAQRFPTAILIAIEQDPLAAAILRANAAVHGLTERLSVRVEDYRTTTLTPIDRPTLFLGNPPYLRHHGIEPRWKQWYGETAAGVGIKASRLAGLHLHFFLKTLTLARRGDFGVLITAAEWLDVNYGAALRQLLADGLGGSMLEVLDAKALPFADAVTTGAITGFRVGARPAALRVRAVATVADLGTLGQGRPVPWAEAAATPRWSVLIRPGPPPPPGAIELGALFRVHRGQATGANQLWIAGPDANGLPARVLVPTVTKARELIAAGDRLSSAALLRRVIDLPADLDALDDADCRVVTAFIERLRRAGGDRSYLASHRNPWWAVRLREPAPILCTYMGRRPPVFVLNACHARHLNIAHGLYPREPMPESVMANLLAHLRISVTTATGRTYAGGLTKFEPREIERLPVPGELLNR